MRFTVFDATDAEIYTKQFYSIGGGFVVGDERAENDQLIQDPVSVEYPFFSCDELLEIARETGKSIAEIVLANEQAWRTTAEIEVGLKTIQQTMNACIERGLRTEGVLPGPMRIARRAPALHRTLTTENERAFGDPLGAMDWIVLYALAVNEENAAGGRVVTAPTNGAAGIVPPACVFSSALSGGPAPPRSATTFSPPGRSAPSMRPTPRSPARRSGVRARSESPVRWPPGASPRPREEPHARSRTPPRSGWSITSG